MKPNTTLSGQPFTPDRWIPLYATLAALGGEYTIAYQPVGTRSNTSLHYGDLPDLIAHLKGAYSTPVHIPVIDFADCDMVLFWQWNDAAPEQDPELLHKYVSLAKQCGAYVTIT